jgi:hypothetical protein
MTSRALWMGIAVCAALGWYFSSARAQEPTPVRHLKCRTFQGVTDREWTIDTSDRTTEIGQWVGQQAGWQVETVDFEVGTKPTGYPSTWAEVCVSRAN